MGSALTLEVTGHPVGVRGLHNRYGKTKAIWYQKTPNTPPLARVCVRVYVCVYTCRRAGPRPAVLVVRRFQWGEGKRLSNISFRYVDFEMLEKIFKMEIYG